MLMVQDKTDEEAKIPLSGQLLILYISFGGATRVEVTFFCTDSIPKFHGQLKTASSKHNDQPTTHYNHRTDDHRLAHSLTHSLVGLARFQRGLAFWCSFLLLLASIAIHCRLLPFANILRWIAACCCLWLPFELSEIPR